MHHQLCTERAGDARKTAVRSQNHPAAVSGPEMSAFQGAGLRFRVSAVHARRDQPAPILRCHTGLCSHHRAEENPRCSPALHHPQHHRAGQAQPGVPRPRPGHPAGRAGQPGPASEHPHPEGGAGHRPEGRREAGEEEEAETEQPQSPELPEEEEERNTDATAEEDRGEGGEEEKKPTQETKSRGRREHGCSCSCKYTEQQEDRDLNLLHSPDLHVYFLM